NGLSIEDMPSVLDFGCGCGRVLRNLSFLYKQSRWHGCDANATPLVWCKQALPAIEFVYNEGQGVMPYETNSMHLIYALSVFSHLDEGALSFWLGELHRILVPGGHFLMTILGTAYLHALSSEERNRFAAGEPVVQGLQNLGENGCAAYYPKSYVLSVTAPHFKLVDHIPGGAVGNGHQDLYLLQKS
ncbi:MAG: class I SAM-dependent methyltransferase, partial [Planctomycetes bacterium]|nr:class I SAM-dependent methyltransferase [Planctomycetota bacterium]